MAIAQTEFETQLSVLSAKLQLAESKLETEKQSLERLNRENGETILDLNTKLTQLQAAVDDKTLELNKGKNYIFHCCQETFTYSVSIIFIF
jgi:tyrosyl-tRNA synthetase